MTLRAGRTSAARSSAGSRCQLWIAEDLCCHRHYVPPYGGPELVRLPLAFEPDERETYSNGVRKVLYRDPDGNELGFGGAPIDAAS